MGLLGLSPTDLVALLGAFVLIYKALKVNAPEVIQAYEQTAVSAAKRAMEAADRAEKAEKTAGQLIIENEALKSQVEGLVATLKDWQRGIGLLIKQITDKGDVPIWKPEGTIPKK